MNIIRICITARSLIVVAIIKTFSNLSVIKYICITTQMDIYLRQNIYTTLLLFKFI